MFSLKYSIMKKKTLIIQGGGFRTAFSAGVIDAFLAFKYNPFDAYFAVSGGAIALSYYMSEQYGSCFEATKYLATEKEFMSYNRLLKRKVLMDLNYFNVVSEKKVPFDVEKAMQNSDGKEVSIVVTGIDSGKAKYFQPNKQNWMDAVIASCTLPFVTKGKHLLNGKEYMDGGWSDALPIQKAVESGSTDVVIIRTSPKDLKVSQSWPDYFGAYAYRSNSNLQTCFENNHKRYNDSIDYINTLDSKIKIEQIAPEVPLLTGTYSNSIEVLTKDYRHGVQLGLDFMYKNIELSIK